ncbi:thioesterase superfamily [Amycolatopsis mediterranei S699]|uniref:Thioesterase superfamily n=1 Tax=Amycolatopsis mediterranei (strain U-32) TaxID=749927 RepID=A0A0H3CVT7_AMYMU|nr:thioesterase family protein [Amycolatopsis mediterranei]ADJ42160.1 thioesterase superfamily [Amycolatopsis mediterranei U32]AFO73868.1 thioesterase superfamily [Amycolatopsis mediterranei S699]AGT80997.1 thioesterase superfamily [Amycolatopsis mediterranei RB]KDO07484.1 thioesterase [Amycolatopsis mediterranei]KDU89393.1 thioesterase [Amycolatopsis mediterranei]
MVSEYPHWQTIPLRWKDNDVYGHANNVVHYSLMDTVINTWLIEQGGLDIEAGAVIGLCVESHCAYHSSVSFPGSLRVGLRVAHLGKSSVRYEIGMYAADESLVAEGHFVHVFVDRESRRPTPVSGKLREALEALQPG